MVGEDMAMEGRALKARGKAMAETGGVVMAAGKSKNATSAGLDAQIPDWYTPKGNGFILSHDQKCLSSPIFMINLP